MCIFCFLYVFCVVFFVDSPSVLWYCWLGLLTCKNRLPYNLYCVGGDVKNFLSTLYFWVHCTIQSNATPSHWEDCNKKYHEFWRCSELDYNVDRRYMSRFDARWWWIEQVAKRILITGSTRPLGAAWAEGSNPPLPPQKSTFGNYLRSLTRSYVICSCCIMAFAADCILLLLNLWPVHVRCQSLYSYFSLCPVKLCVCSCSLFIFDYYKTVIWTASLMSCWLLWQPVAVSIYYLRFSVRPPGTLVPKAFCFSRDVFFNQTQDLRAPSADHRETLHSDQHMRQLFNANPKLGGSSPKKFYPR